MSDIKNVLVIRLGALGDILLCMKAFQDIRAAHKEARVSLLTMPAFAGLARQMPWFDAVIEDPRPRWWQWQAWKKLHGALSKPSFDCVIDIQNKPRTRFYKKVFFNAQTQWSSCTDNSTFPLPAFPHAMHRQEEVLAQLRCAAIGDSGALNLDWLAAPMDGFHLPPRYAVFVPGCSPHLAHKRWPPQAYARLAETFAARGCSVVLVGTKADAQSIADIKAQVKAEGMVDVSGKTSFAQLASLYRGAVAVVGNDTGPTFLAAMVGAPTLTLMSHHTDPVRSGPIGSRCSWLKENKIADISVEDVQAKLAALG